MIVKYFERVVLVQKPLLVVIAIVLVLAISMVFSYNSLVSMDEAITAQWAQVDNVLQRRYDLIPNLVETVKGYASHEKEIFQDIAYARSRLLGAQGPDERARASGEMESALGRLLAITENYPTLKANENFKSLMYELSGTENRIAVERQRYNESVRAYNSKIKRFPTSILASLFDFSQRAYFEIPEAARTAPKVTF
jgi:LemA protein